MKFTKESVAARKAAAAKFSKMALETEQKKIKEAGGMKYHHVVDSRTESKFTYGGIKVLHKSRGGDKFSQQARYAKAMQ